jgi:lipopolysaccharide export system protein LptA
MLYLRNESHIRYQSDVDMRQGTDRITAGLADVFLDADNSLSRTVAQNNVVITQPNRKATGDFAQYDAIAETVILKGNPARFSDSESGSTSGKTLSVDLKTKRAINNGSETKNGSGRIRSVYKVKNGRIN